MKGYALGFASLLLLAACAEDKEPAPPTADIEAGRAIAEANCAGCHGLDGQGATSEIPNLAAQPAEYLESAMSAYKDGTRHHAALQDMVSGMTGQGIRDIAAYYASQPPVSARVQEPVSPVSESSYAEGEDVGMICAECHGSGGYSTTPGVPSLAGQQPAYLIASTQEYVRGNRGHQEKEEMLQGLDRVDIEKMAMYFASQTPHVREAPPFGDPQRGEPLSASCGECHGARGISHDPLVPSLAGQEPFYLVNAIKAYLSGEREHEDMNLDATEEEIKDIAAYYAVQHAEAAADPAAPVRELAAKCDRCHGPAVGESTMIVPTLNGQSREYLVRVMKAYRDDDRGSSMMHKMSANYSDEMIETIATYYASRPAE